MSRQSAEPAGSEWLSAGDQKSVKVNDSEPIAPRTSTASAPRPPLPVRVVRRIWNDILASRPPFLLIQLLVSLIPRMAFGWLRPALYRLAGVRIGHKTQIYGKVEIEGAGPVLQHVTIGDMCLLTTPLYLNASGRIQIGHHVTIGHHVVVVTDNHRMTEPAHRGGERYSAPVTIEDGVWVGASVTILPGVTLGRGCVVAAGSLVARDVPPDTLVGGVPARPIKEL